MDNKVIMIAAIAVVAVIAIAGVAVVMNNDDGKNVEPAAISVDSGAVLSGDDLAAGLADASGDKLIIGLKASGAESTVSFNASDLKQVVDAKKNLVIRTGNNDIALDATMTDAIAKLSGTVVLKSKVVSDSAEIVKVIGEKYTEARAMANFTVCNESGTALAVSGKATISVPYRLDSLMDETADTAVQWDKDLKCSAAKYANGTATITANAGENVYLAFMTPEDSAYYPVSYTTKANGFTDPVEQTVTHRPTKIVTLYEATTEVALLFGLKDNIVMSCANSSYACVNTELQAVYNSLPGRTEYENVTNSTELIVAAEPDLILGWSSSWQDGGQWTVGTPGVWNERGCNVFSCNVYNKTLADYYTLINTLGLIMNMADRADEITSAFTASVAASEEKLATNNVTEKKRVIVIEDGSAESGTFLYGAQYFCGDLISKVGGIDVVDAGMVRKTTEEILAYCYDDDDNCIVDAVFLFNRSGKTAEETIQAFRDNVPYSDLAAAVGDNVFVFGFYELYMGGVVQNGILEKIFGCLYPDLVE
ncbi:MAG: ABC transporter substrate-binding protein [archaeon]|nr:ABC transporter substrate-binding protein [archaeon]